MTTTKIWVVCGLLYGCFFYWYTSFGGPLTEVEIDGYIDAMEARIPPAPPETMVMLRRFLEEDTGDDFVMVNIIEMYDMPLQIEGVEAGESSAEVLDKYMSYMYPALFARASHPVLFGSAANTAMDLLNAPGMARWTMAAGMRYRSRRDMMDITVNPAFRGSHDFKIAAMAKTIAFPIDPWFQLGDPRFVLALLLALIGSLLSWLSARRA